MEAFRCVMLGAGLDLCGRPPTAKSVVILSDKLSQLEGLKKKMHSYVEKLGCEQANFLHKGSTDTVNPTTNGCKQKCKLSWNMYLHNACTFCMFGARLVCSVRAY